MSPDGTGSIVAECDSWIDVDWFIAVKARKDTGLTTQDTPISEIVCHAADYAQLHLSSRPFQLFSVGLLIFGRKFMVGIFDRDGVSLSPISDVCDGGEGFKTFIKVVRRLIIMETVTQEIRKLATPQAGLWCQIQGEQPVQHDII